jgi:hypothetical protein
MESEKENVEAGSSQEPQEISEEEEDPFDGEESGSEEDDEKDQDYKPPISEKVAIFLKTSKDAKKYENPRGVTKKNLRRIKLSVPIMYTQHWSFRKIVSF